MKRREIIPHLRLPNTPIFQEERTKITHPTAYLSPPTSSLSPFLPIGYHTTRPESRARADFTISNTS